MRLFDFFYLYKTIMISLTFYVFTLSFMIHPQLNTFGKWFVSQTEVEDPAYTCYMTNNNTWTCISRHELNDYDPGDSY